MSQDLREYLLRDHWAIYSTTPCWQNLLESTKREAKDRAILFEVYTNNLINKCNGVIEDAQRIYKRAITEQSLATLSSSVVLWLRPGRRRECNAFVYFWVEVLSSPTRQQVYTDALTRGGAAELANPPCSMDWVGHPGRSWTLEYGLTRQPSPDKAEEEEEDTLRKGKQDLRYHPVAPDRTARDWTAGRGSGGQEHQQPCKNVFYFVSLSPPKSAILL
ncbi:unnamed protein product [Cyprideis torosa]|uniref:Uncharacterized protein n=1 Tax=Cyprideis torosa TaxID=163714 RepID=A0A7R8WBP9_9CRUS|nr:unnamed protein product [Cyprideis torosa]CAG0892489.1 unnamed protein product [Cyprideis torosa]